MITLQILLLAIVVIFLVLVLARNPQVKKDLRKYVGKKPKVPK